ncbi:MAG: hypothetical protein PVI30_19285 [Myxococcales bacterium]
MGAVLVGLMIGSLVVVDVTTPDPAGDAAAAAVVAASCNDALEQVECVPASSAPDASDDADRVRVHVRMGAGDGHAAIEFVGVDGRVSSERIEFRPGDPPAARQRAVGLVIAALRMKQRSEAATAAQATASAATAPEPTAPSDASPVARAWLLDAGLLLGPGLSGKELRYGGLVRAGRRLGETPLHAVVAGRGAVAFGDVDARWLSADAGLLLTGALQRRVLSLTVHASVRAEHVDARATDAATGEQDIGSALRFGGALGAELALQLSSSLALFAGAELALTERLVVEVGDTIVGRQPPLQLTAAVGLRTRL